MITVTCRGTIHVAFVAMLASVAVACGDSSSDTSDTIATSTPSSPPSTTLVAEMVVSAATTTEPVDVPDALNTAVTGILDDFRGAVLVARGDDVLLSEGYGDADVAAGIPNEPTTRFRIGSVTKQFTGLAILMLREQGLLDVTDPVCDHLASCRPAWQPITIENLVAHTSGIPDFTELDEYEATKAVATTPDDLVGRVRDLPLTRDPGGYFSYSNSNYAVLGLVIEKLSGMTYEQFLRVNIFEPLGMSSTGFEADGDGRAVGYSEGNVETDAIDMSVPYASGALSSTVGDLLRWNRALASGTAAPGRVTIDMMTPIERMTDSSGFGYGYGVYVSTEEDALTYHDGGIDGFTSVVVNDVGNEISVVILSNRNNSGDIVSAAWRLRDIALGG